jgi:predicted nucleic acid-binding protein
MMAILDTNALVRFLVSSKQAVRLLGEQGIAAIVP